MTKEERQKQLLKWSDSYYNKSISLVPDSVYDAAYNSFKNDCPNDPFLKTVGAPIDKASEWKKATHKIPMGSLNKVTNENEFANWERLRGGIIYCISLKLDGISIELEYENGYLVKAITRGDGFIGEDITKNVRRMQNVKEKIKDFTGSTRGEIILKQHDFETIVTIQEQRDEEPLKNMRNGASGIAKRYDGQYSEYLSIIYYDVTEQFDTKSKKFDYMKSQYLNTAYIETGNYDDVIIIYEKYNSTLRANLDYLIDGLVVEIDDIKLYDLLGQHDNRPKGAVAYKFTSEKAIAEVVDVVWELGKSGTLTPVIHIEPTKIGGVTVSKMTAHNLDFFRKLKLYKGCKILFERANDVIPIPIKVVN